MELKISDIMNGYEDIALQFYDDSTVLHAISENAALYSGTSPEALLKYEENSFLIENSLYNLGEGQKYIMNIQFVTPYRQYHMAEANGYPRGGTIRDLDSFYESDFYLLPQIKHGYPVWMDSSLQTATFYKNSQNLYGIANIITLGVAVYDPMNRDFLGVLLLNVNLNAFSGAVENYNAYNDGNIFLIGQDGLLAWFNPTLSAPPMPKDPALYSELKSQDNHILRTKLEGQKILVAGERVENTQIFIVYLADLNVLLAHTHQVRNLCILVLICITIVCIVLAYSVSFSISAPVRQLVSVMKKTGEG